MFRATEVTLANGEKIQLALDSVCNQRQIFVRIGKRLVAGVVDRAKWQGIYIWQEVDGVYQGLGDIVFNELEDGSVIWDVYPKTGLNTPEFEKRAVELLVEQGKTHASGFSTNHMMLLSNARVVPV
jgi:hypothetical protein